MDFRDRTTRDDVTEIAALLAEAYQRYRRARRVEIEGTDRSETVNRDIDNACPESLHGHEVDA